jgi:GNAT superfamily N-acetyltransferase
MIRELGRPGDLGWVIQAHGERYAAEYGFDSRFEALVARIVADYAAGHDPSREAAWLASREAAWLAEADGERAGCVFCVDGGDETAVLRLLLVTPAARGRGLGGALVDTCLEFARKAGYRRMRLWTTDPLVAARHVYLARGVQLIDAAPHRGFGVDVIGQTYALDL